jgi:hypothetical protein
MGPRGWLLTFALLVLVVFLTAALLKWFQSTTTSVPKRRLEDEEK